MIFVSVIPPQSYVVGIISGRRLLEVRYLMPSGRDKPICLTVTQLCFPLCQQEFSRISRKKNNIPSSREMAQGGKWSVESMDLTRV